MANAHRLYDFKNIFGTLSYIAIAQFSCIAIYWNIHAVFLKHSDILIPIRLTNLQYPEINIANLLEMT